MADTVTLLDFDQVTTIEDTDIVYLVRGTGVDRDKVLPGSVLKAYLGETLLTVTATGSIDLSTYKTNVFILVNPTMDISLTITGALPGGNKCLIFNKSAFKLTLSIISTAPELFEKEYAEYFSDNTAMSLLGIHRITADETTYNPATPYAVDASVDYYGVQYISLQGSNTGNNPLFATTYWKRAPELKELISQFQEGKPVHPGVHPIHDVRSSDYKQFFKIGNYVQGGKTLEAWGVHIDGVVITGDIDLESIFRVGESDEYAYLDTFGPDSVGTRTLKNYMGRAAMSIDPTTGGERVAVGEVQADQFQGFKIDPGSGISFLTTGTTNNLVSAGDVGLSTFSDLLPLNDGVNGTPRTGTTTYPKNYSVGVPYIVVLKEVA